MALLIATLMTLSSPQTIVEQAATVVGENPAYFSCIVQHESGWNPQAVGDNGAAVGMWQWHIGSWQHVRNQMALPLNDERDDPIQSTLTAAYAIGVLGLDDWWAAAGECRHYQE